MSIARPTAEAVFMYFAEMLAQRSTCERLRVGAVITNGAMTKVLGIGYNGNARGFPNECDRPNMPGNCGCIHAESNALLKADGTEPDQRMFLTHSPCVPCAKLIINSGVRWLYYRDEYRNPDGLAVLGRAGVVLIPMDKPREKPRELGVMFAPQALI